jgi:topoisomerase-4 subunit A
MGVTVAFIKNIFEKNFIEYASYVIKDRAIPDLEDGLKPVQRRILHTLFEMDDGKFHKVANVVGQCMKYHPHGDASIAGALVVLANKDYFIDRQGNFGNIFTGDAASASRYIECRITPMAAAIFHNPKLTEYADSYDGRNREPVLFPAKAPVVLFMGAEGIAVGMSTKILPHNFIEVLEAEKAALHGEPFQLYPDFPTAGLVDVSDYQDGNGKVLVRASLDTSDPKRIVIRELPFGSTTESMMASIEAAAKAGRIKILSLNDFTTSQVEIEIRLARGVYAEETLDALYAFTECEQSLSVNLLVIRDGLPSIMSITEVVNHHAKQLILILTRELELEKRELQDKLRLRTLERIFIEERIYKAIEGMKTAEAVEKAVIAGFAPFAAQVARVSAEGVNAEDVEHLLRIPIRRISLYDNNKAKAEMEAIKARVRTINAALKNIVGYGVEFLDGIIERIRKNEELGRGLRKTRVGKFERIDIKGISRKEIEVKYDDTTGYLGSAVVGRVVAELSEFDRILTVRQNGTYSVGELPEKSFVGPGAWYIAAADKEALATITFTIIYREAKTGYACIKRCVIEGWIMNKDYSLVPEGAEVLHIDTRETFSFTLNYTPKPRIKTKSEQFNAQDFPVKGLKPLGTRLAARPAESITL